MKSDWKNILEVTLMEKNIPDWKRKLQENSNIVDRVINDWLNETNEVVFKKGVGVCYNMRTLFVPLIFSWVDLMNRRIRK